MPKKHYDLQTASLNLTKRKHLPDAPSETGTVAARGDAHARLKSIASRPVPPVPRQSQMDGTGENRSLDSKRSPSPIPTYDSDEEAAVEAAAAAHDTCK